MIIHCQASLSRSPTLAWCVLCHQLGSKTCLATHPGLLARYGHMNLIAALAADVGRHGGPRGLGVLAPDNGQHSLPTLNGTPIPLTNTAQHTRLTSA